MKLAVLDSDDPSRKRLLQKRGLRSDQFERNPHSVLPRGLHVRQLLALEIVNDLTVGEIEK